MFREVGGFRGFRPRHLGLMALGFGSLSEGI